MINESIMIIMIDYFNFSKNSGANFMPKKCNVCARVSKTTNDIPQPTQTLCTRFENHLKIKLCHY